MDSSTSHQSVALVHALKGVAPSELNGKERLTVVKDKLLVLTSWGSRSPGFQPQGFRVGDYKAKLPKGVNRKTKILELARVGHVREPINGTTRTTVKSTYLLVTIELRFLIETRYNEGESDIDPPYIEVVRCSDAKAAEFLNDDRNLIHTCEAINRAVASRVDQLRRDLEVAMQLQSVMGRTFLSRTL